MPLYPPPAVGGADGVNIIAAGTQTAQTTGTVLFNNSNGVTFGMSNSSVVTASYTRNVASNAIQGVGSATGSGTNTTRFAADDHVHAGVFSLGISNDAGNTAGDTRVDVGRFIFRGGNNVTLSQITAANALNTIVISGGAAGAADGINALVVNAGGSTASTTLTLSNSNNISFGHAAGVITATATFAQTNQTGGVYHVGNTTGQSSSSTYDLRTLSIDGAGIVSAGWSAGSIRISATQSNQAFSADASSTFQTLTFQNSNGVSFSNNAGALRVTHDLMLSTSRPAFSADASSTFQTLTFQNSNGFTFSNNAGAIRASYTRNVASNALQSVGSATGSGTNTSRFAADDHVHAGVFSVGVSNDAGNTSGDTRVDVGRFVFRGGNNITLSQITAANALNTIVVSGGAGGAGISAGLSNIGNTSGDTGAVTGRLILAGGNNITLSGSTNGGSMTITVSAPNLGAGAMSAGVSNLGNTAGSTGITGTQLVLVGSGVISLSQSTGANGGTVSINAPATSSLVGVSGITVSTNGSTISVQPATASGWNPYADLEKIAGQYGQATLQFDPMRCDGPAQWDRVVIPILNTNSSNSSGSHTLSFWIGLYTKNASTLSRLTSTSSSTAVTHSGTVGSYSLYSGQRLFTIPMTTTISGGDYWMGFVSRTTSGGTNGTYSHFVASNIASNFLGHFGSSHATTAQLTLGQGLYTATTSGIPASVGFSEIRGSDSLARRAAFIMFASGTV